MKKAVGANERRLSLRFRFKKRRREEFKNQHTVYLDTGPQKYAHLQYSKQNNAALITVEHSLQVTYPHCQTPLMSVFKILWPLTAVQVF